MSNIDPKPYPVAAAPTGKTGLRYRFPGFRSIAVLFKLRIVVLLLVTAVGGAFLGAGGWSGWSILSLTILTGGLVASGASAFNQYLERDSDGLMNRTKRRPLVDGTINPAWVPYVATALIFIPSLVVLPFNPPLTFFLLLGAAIYVILYTLILKPRTLLNIVIGGAAGSAAVLSGSAAAGNWSDPGAIVLALLVFLWTPTHFWSLAIVYREDYARGNTPMLPTQTTMKQSAWWVMAHAVPTAFAALMLVAHPALSWLYFIPVALATVDLIRRNIILIRTPTARLAMSLFKVSNLYLALIIVMICVDAFI